MGVREKFTVVFFPGDTNFISIYIIHRYCYVNNTQVTMYRKKSTNFKMKGK